MDRLAFSNRWMFNRVMCQESICRQVIEAAFGLEVERIDYLNAEQAFEPGAETRGVRMDVVAKGDGRIYDIEMQVANRGSLGKRMRYYQSILDTTGLGRGEDYERLPKSFILFVCCVDPFGAGLPVYTLLRACLEVPSLDVDEGSCWKVLNARAWERADDPVIGDLLEYLQTGVADGALSREIDGLVGSYNEDWKWVSRVFTLEQEMALERRHAKEEGREEGMSRLAVLTAHLVREGRSDDVVRVSEDPAFRDRLFAEFGI